MSNSHSQQFLSASKSTADNPDLDWSQVKETMTMLCLAIAQIRTSLTDGTQSVGKLTDSFTDIANKTDHITQMTNSLTPDNLDTSKKEIVQSIEYIAEKIHYAVVSFQFYDRMCQRLDHVAGSLDNLGQVISDPTTLYSPSSWKELQDHIRSSYSMEAERIMFEYIMRGATIQEALDIYNHHFDSPNTKTKKNENDDDVELF